MDKIIIKYFPFEWQNLLFLFSLNAVFIWTAVISLGDAGFDLVDAQFLLQIELRLIGFIILSWAFSVLLSNIIRFLILSVQGRILKYLRFRRFRRFVVRRFLLEAIFVFVIFLSSIIEDFYKLILFVVAFVLAGEAVSRLYSVVLKGKTLSQKRQDLKQERAPDVLSGLKGALSLINRDVDRLGLQLNIMIRASLIILSLGMGVGHAEKLKNGKQYIITTTTAKYAGSIVGQTRYGVLTWEQSCNCLNVVSFSQLVDISPITPTNL